MKIVADENMPLVREMFSAVDPNSSFEITLLPGRQITPDDIADADALLVRSVTPVNKALLADSNIGFVGSATIGVDHVDTAYLHSRNIAFASAPGCNAGAVVQYVLSSLCACEPRWLDKTIGIIGCGNTGGGLYRTLLALEMSPLCYDPFLNKEKIPHLASLEEVLAADIVCLHTPITRQGTYPTFHMLNADRLAQLKEGTLLINAGRGAVIDNQALLKILESRPDIRVVLDVWENEPGINADLLSRVSLGTPHIAGYSQEGKVAGTRMIRDAFCHWLGLSVPAEDSEPPSEDIVLAPDEGLCDAILRAFDVREDDHSMRQLLPLPEDELPDRFDALRKNYRYRREFSHFRVSGKINRLLKKQLQAVRFTL